MSHNRGSRLRMSKVLVVDDSKTIRMILRRILKEIGFEVCEAENGVEALKVIAVENDAVSLILADWNMPEMNGLELLRTVRKRPELRPVKVVMVTTEAEMTHMTAALQEGADEYVMKPFTKDILVEKLEMIGILPSLQA